MSAHFKVHILSDIPPQVYFVNFCFPELVSVPTHLLLHGTYASVNNIDHCYDQSIDGPCQFIVFNPDMKPNSVRSSFRKTKRGKKQNSTLLKWQRRHKVVSEYNLVYFPQFNIKDHRADSMGVVIPSSFLRPKPKNEVNLPPGWILEWVLNFEHKTKLPNGVTTEEMLSSPFKFCSSMEQRLTYDGSNLRIFLVQEKSSWDHLKVSGLHVEFGDTNEAIISESCMSPLDIDGMMVSVWKHFPTSTLQEIDKKIDYGFGLEVYHIYRCAFGSRFCSRCRSVNMMLGERNNERALPTPSVGVGETGKQQYYHQNWSDDGKEFRRLLIEKIILYLYIALDIIKVNFKQFFNQVKPTLNPKQFKYNQHQL